MDKEHNPDHCPCGSGEPKTKHYDGYGIFLFYACPECENEKMSRYRPDIMERYECEEPIEEE